MWKSLSLLYCKRARQNVKQLVWDRWLPREFVRGMFIWPQKLRTRPSQFQYTQSRNQFALPLVRTTGNLQALLKLKYEDHYRYDKPQSQTLSAQDVSDNSIDCWMSRYSLHSRWVDKILTFTNAWHSLTNSVVNRFDTIDRISYLIQMWFGVLPWISHLFAVELYRAQVRTNKVRQSYLNL